MSNKTSDKNVAQDIEFLKSNEADVLYFRGNPKLKSAVESVLEKIEELEKDNKRKDMFVQMSQEVIENSIPKQVVIDELKRLSDMLNRTTEGRIQKYTVNEIIIRSNALQELLEGEK